LGRHGSLDRSQVLAPSAGQHRADRPAADQTSGNEIHPLRALLPDHTPLRAALRAKDILRLDALLHHFEVLRQGATHWFARLPFDLRRHDHIDRGGGFGVLEHLIEKRELMLFDLNPFGFGSEELLFDASEFELEKAVLRFELKHTDLKLIKGESFGFVLVRHIIDIACSLPT
jgi:hypothetical protein